MKKIIIPHQELLFNLPTMFYNFNYMLQNNRLNYLNVNMFASNEFKLFYYLNENYINDFLYITGKEFDSDFYGFIPVWRNARNSTETLLDLYNLVHIPNYIQVLEYQNLIKRKEKCIYRKNIDIALVKYITKHDKETGEKYYIDFTLQIKGKIARDYGYKGAAISLIDDKSEIATMNRYVHSSIFIEPNYTDDDKKLDTAKKLLLYELTLYFEAFHILQVKFTGKHFVMPYDEPTIPLPNIGLVNCSQYVELCKQAIMGANLPKEPQPNTFFQNFPSNMYM